MIRMRGKITGLILIPMLAVVLPWSWFYRIARALSRYSWLYKKETQMAAEGIKHTNQFFPDAVWRRHFRLYKIVDAVDPDPWLFRFRSRGWIEKNVDVDGEWPQNTPFAVSSLHFGAGLWVLRHVLNTRGAIATVSRPQDEWDDVFSTPMRFYLRAFEQIMMEAGGGPMIPTGGGLKQRLKARVDAGYNLLFLIDVPNSKNTTAVEFLGRPTYFALGLVNLTRQLAVPIVPYVMTLDFRTGRRKLVIGQQLKPEIGIQQAMQELVDFYDPFVRKQSEGWQLWGEYIHFIESESRRNKS